MGTSEATDRPQDIAYGECWCGCGATTTIASQTHRRDGWVRGEPLRFIRGHHRRFTARWPTEVEDHGHETPCVVWTGYVGRSGYGHVSSGGRVQNAHRVAYERVHGPLAPDVHVDHLCSVRACVNVEHLEAVTGAENTRRGAAARLTWEIVQRIRSEGRSTRDLAVEHGVTERTISAARSGETWAVRS